MGQHIIFLVEEPSMEEFLETLLLRLFPDNSTPKIHSFQGKKALLKKLPDRLRGYKKWLPSDYRLFVLIDCDSDDCLDLKNQLEDIARKAGFISRSQNSRQWQLVNRIVIQELEAWYFGDWEAVRQSYTRMPDISNRSKYSTPDDIDYAWETFEKELQKCGYFKTGLRKIEAACTIAAHIDPKRNRSHSFKKFYETVIEANL